MAVHVYCCETFSCPHPCPICQGYRSELTDGHVDGSGFIKKGYCKGSSMSNLIKETSNTKKFTMMYELCTEMGQLPIPTAHLIFLTVRFFAINILSSG